MAIFTAVAGAIAGVLFGGSVLATTLIAAGLAFGTQLLVSYLTRPKKRTYSANQDEIQIGGRVPAQVLFGKGATKGHHVYYAKYGSGNKYNADVFVLSNGWCDGLEPEVYFYGEKHTMRLAGGAGPLEAWEKYLGKLPQFNSQQDFINYWGSWPNFQNGLQAVGFVLNGILGLVRSAIPSSPSSAFGNATEVWVVNGYDGKITIRFYDGRPGQEADAALVANTANLDNPWKSTSRVSGMAYVIVEREWDEELFEKGHPEFKFVLRGVKEYDPRFDSTVAGGSGPQRLNNSATWVWTQNPAVHRLNYQLGLRGLISNRTLIGEGKSLGQLDLNSYFAAMNVSDTLRAGKPTYQASLFVNGDDDHTEVLKEFDDAMAGYGMNRRGLSGVIVGAPQSPAATLTDADIDAERGKQIQHRKSAFDLYNHLSGQFISPEAHWEAESLKPIYVNADVSADGRVRQTANDFLQVTDPDIAQYLLQIRYRQQRKGGSATVPVSRRFGLRVMEGEWISYAGKTWLITGWQMDEELRITLTLAETGADVYASEGIVPGPIVVEPPTPINPSLLSVIQNFQAEAGYITNDAGHDQPALWTVWTPPEDPTITQVRFEYRINDGFGGDSTTLLMRDAMGDPEAGEYYITKGVLPEKPYAIRATITTVPDRLKTFTPWVLTDPTGGFNVQAYLRNLQKDVRDLIANLDTRLRDIRPQIEQLAMDVAIGQGKQVEQHSAVVRTEQAIAGSLLELTAEVDELGNATAEALLAVFAELEEKATAQALLELSSEVTALEEATSQAILGVQAEVGLVSAGGLIQMVAQVPPPSGVLSQINILARASTSAQFVQSGMVIQVYQQGSNIRSRIVFLTDQFIVSDGTATHLPMVFEGGVLKLNDVKVNWADIENVSIGTAQIQNAAITSAWREPLRVVAL